MKREAQDLLDSFLAWVPVNAGIRVADDRSGVVWTEPNATNPRQIRILIDPAILELVYPAYSTFGQQTWGLSEDESDEAAWRTLVLEIDEHAPFAHTNREMKLTVDRGVVPA